jgi:hypothetical protein
MSFEITDSIVEGWSARTSLRGGSGANLQLKATGGEDILSLLGDTYSIYADVDGTTWPVYTGILQSGTLSTSASSSGVSFDVELSSQVASLDNKPINTEKFGDSTTPVTSQSILTTMFDRYGSIDSSLYSFGGSYGSVFEYITVQGDSLIQEARLIAQADGKEMFVNSSGVLRVEDHAVATLLGFHSIPDWRIKSCSRSDSHQEAFSVVRVRGRYVSLEDLGPATWYNQSVTVTPPPNTFLVEVTIMTGGTQAEVLAATWSSSTAATTVILLSTTDSGSATFQLLRSGASGFSSPEAVNLQCVGPNAWGVERDSLSLQTLTNIKTRAMRSNSKVFGSDVGRRSFVNWGWKSQKSPDEVEESRIDVVGSDATLISRFGVRWYEVDNVYIPTVSKATEVGTRALKEFENSATTYELDTIWDGSLGVNDVARFTDPFSESLVYGVVVECEISYDVASSNLSGRFVVEKIDAPSMGR